MLFSLVQKINLWYSCFLHLLDPNSCNGLNLYTHAGVLPTVRAKWTYMFTIIKTYICAHNYRFLGGEWLILHIMKSCTKWNMSIPYLRQSSSSLTHLSVDYAYPQCILNVVDLSPSLILHLFVHLSSSIWLINVVSLNATTSYLLWPLTCPSTSLCLCHLFTIFF